MQISLHPPKESSGFMLVADVPSRNLANELEEQRVEIADLQERVKALAAKRKEREALAQQVSDAATSDALAARPRNSANAVDK